MVSCAYAAFFSGIHVHCSGRAKVEWYERDGKDTRIYKNKEDYVDQEAILFGKCKFRMFRIYLKYIYWITHWYT